MAAKTGPLGIRYSPWSIAFTVIVIGIVYELVSPAVWQLVSALPKSFLVAVVVVGATTIVAAFLSDNIVHFQRPLKVASAILLLAEIGLFIYAVYEYYPTQPSATSGVSSISGPVAILTPGAPSPATTPSIIPSLSPAIFVGCRMVSLPVTIAPNAAIHLIGINRKYMQSWNSGFFDISNDSNKEEHWPDEKTMKSNLKTLSKQLWDQTGTRGYRCDVNNHGPDNALYVTVPIDFWFGGDKKPVRYEPIIPSLDVNQTFTFYLFNSCPDNVAGIWQQMAKVETPQKPSLHSLKLLREYRYSAEQVMVFFPSSIPWIRETPCD